MVDCERRVLETSGLPIDSFEREFVTIEIDGEPFEIRTVILASTLKDAKTLVLTHGFGMYASCYSSILSNLQKHFRVILVDNLSWGLNTRRNSCKGFESAEAAEQWVVEWWEKWISAMKEVLPEKIMLCGHSMGGLQLSWYASRHPERVDSLLLLSPAGFQPRCEDPYVVRSQIGVNGPAPRSYVDIGLRVFENPEQNKAQDEIRKLPEWVFKLFFWKIYFVNQMKDFSVNDYTAHKDIVLCMLRNHGVIEQLPMKAMEYFSTCKNPVSGEKYLGNPNIKFPIGFVYGDRDLLGSEGSTDIIRANVNFQNGQSQLFKVKNSDHNLYFDNPKELAEVMIGFFNRTVSHQFQEKATSEYAQ